FRALHGRELGEEAAASQRLLPSPEGVHDKRAIDALEEGEAVRATHEEANWGGARLGS
ncbi:unnamed protein product, partial [Phaeothamnion confervicola]